MEEVFGTIFLLQAEDGIRVMGVTGVHFFFQAEDGIRDTEL